METVDDVPTLLSDDMRKEMLRQKWEKEELEAMNGPIHYSNAHRHVIVHIIQNIDKKILGPLWT
jgi:hypothetical protein